MADPYKRHDIVQLNKASSGGLRRGTVVHAVKSCRWLGEQWAITFECGARYLNHQLEVGESDRKPCEACAKAIEKNSHRTVASNTRS